MTSVTEAPATASPSIKDRHAASVFHPASTIEKSPACSKAETGT
nr:MULTISPECIES: hypothetical protein [unclassified Pseudonocardia]